MSTFRYDSETDLSVGQEIKVERLGKFRITKVHKNEGSHVHSAAAKKIDPA
ncbi:hypothetical protein KKH39_02800 [Patescibacteria group bacterium]|nr:hypothetical protein [Patescibacteria group bacterium]